MRREQVHQPHFGYIDDREIRQIYRSDRYHESNTRRREADCLLREDYAMVVVNRRDLSDIGSAPIIIMMVGRQSGAQRRKDEEHDPVGQSIEPFALHSAIMAHATLSVNGVGCRIP